MAQSRPQYEVDSVVLQQDSPDIASQAIADFDSYYLAQTPHRLLACLFGGAGLLIGLLVLIARSSSFPLWGSSTPQTQMVSPALALSLLALGSLVILIALVRNTSLTRLTLLPAYLLMLLQMLLLLDHAGPAPRWAAILLPPGAHPVQVDNRAAVPAAVALLLLSLALALWRHWHRRQMVVALAVASGAISADFALHCAYGYPSVYATGFGSRVLPAAIGIFLGSVGVLCAGLGSLAAMRRRQADVDRLRGIGNERLAELIKTRQERKDALRELEQERRVLATIIEQMPAGVMAVAKPGLTVIRTNLQAREILGGCGQEQRDLFDDPIELMEPDGTPIPREQWPVVRALYDGYRTQGRELLVAVDGNTIPVREYAAPTLDDAGEVIGAVLAFYDLSRERQAEAERKTLTIQAQRRAAELDAVISSIADGVSITDATGTLIRCNDASRRMLRYEGYEHSDWAGRAERCRYLRADGSEFPHDELPLSRSLRGETITGEIIQMMWPDGSSTWVTSSSAPLRNEQGQLLGVVLTNTDMTALRETQQETQRLLAQVQAEREWMFCLLDTLPAYVCLIRPDHQIAYANGRFAELFGAPSEGEKCYQRIVGIDSACENCHAFTPLGTGCPTNHEWQHPTREMVLDVTNYAFTDLNGQLVSLEVGVEITARVAAEQEVQRHRDHLEDLISERTARLAESERQYRELVENANAVILRFGADGRFTMANQYAHDLFGYAPGELLGQPCTLVLPESDSSGANLKFIKDALLSHDEEWQFNENENITKDGRLLWISWSNHVNLNEAGETEDVLCVGIDRTAQHEGGKKLREYQDRLRALASELVNAEQRERQRVATLLHDEVAQTLGALKLHLSLLPGKWPEAAADVIPLIAMADDAVQETRSIMTQLSPPILQRFGIVDALRWWGDVLREREGLQVRVEAPEIPIVVDTVRRTAVFQAVKELLRNVVKHSGASEARVLVYADEATLHVEVCDNGKGFDPEATTTTATAGFGLFAVRERMAHLGGSMTVISQSHNGTSIVLRLPRTS